MPKDKLRVAGGALPATPRSNDLLEEAIRWLSDGTLSEAWAGAGNSDEVAQDVHSKDVDARLERVLLADDNADMREYVRRLLGERYRVVTVSNGEEALKSALKEPPDLILSDVMMPGLDGVRAVAGIREPTPKREPSRSSSCLRALEKKAGLRGWDRVRMIT